MSNVKYIEDSPICQLERDEYYGLVLNFCSYVCMVKNKKMNFPSIFVEIIKNQDMLDLYCNFCGFSDERKAMLEFMQIDDSIIRSKFLKKYINQRNA